MVSPSAAAFTVSSHEVLDLDKVTHPEPKSAQDVCDTPGCVLAGKNIYSIIFKTKLFIFSFVLKRPRF